MWASVISKLDYLIDLVKLIHDAQKHNLPEVEKQAGPLDPHQLFSIVQTTEILKCVPSTLRRRTLAGLIDDTKLGRHTFYKGSQIMKAMENHSPSFDQVKKIAKAKRKPTAKSKKDNPTQTGN